MATEQPDDASVSSEDASILILAQVDDSILVPPPVRLTVPPCTYADALLGNGIPSHNGHSSTPDGAIFTQDATQVPCRPISSDLLLLDSQSTVHLFSQHNHVHNICPAKNPIRFHCNKGTSEATQEADFGDTPVYFESRGIVNVLSLYQLGQKFKVTYDSTDRGGIFKVFTKAGVIEFAPTVKGLHAINSRKNPDAAYLLVKDANLAFHSPVQTEHHNHEGFTKKQVQRTTLAHRIMG